MKNFVEGRGDYPGLSKWAWCNHKDPYREEAEGQRSEDATLLALKMKERDLESKNADGLRELGRAREEILSESLQKECGPVDLFLDLWPLEL